MRFSAILGSILALGAAASIQSYNSQDVVISRATGIDDMPFGNMPAIAYGPGGHTQGSSRDTAHERHRNRLARRARRVERLHRHTATGRHLLAKVSA